MTEYEISKQVKKPIDMATHAEAVAWCGANNALFIDKGDYYEIVPIPVKSLSEAKSEKLLDINLQCDNILNAAISTYPETEVLTFDQQTSEANAYLASQNPADAPLLTALAAGRGITLDDLVQRVIAKHDAFSLLSGYVIGQRQALEDQLELCETVGEVQAIAVTITLPEAGNAEAS